ncbi:MAG TPA: hypothetical protein VKV31_01850 [bacterium]|nr:hypothetical protein [bacterium]
MMLNAVKLYKTTLNPTVMNKHGDLVREIDPRCEPNSQSAFRVSPSEFKYDY